MAVYTPQSLITTPLPGKVSAWSVDADLQGTGVPGQARTRSGVSTRGGQITVTEASGKPWKASIVPGQPVTIDAALDRSIAASRLFTGKITSLSASSAISPELVATVKEATPKKRALTLPYYTPEVTSGDMSRLVHDAARICGWYTAPPVDKTDFLNAPLHGSMIANVGMVSTNSEGGKWVTVDGKCALQLEAGHSHGYMQRPEPVGSSHGTVSLKLKFGATNTLTIIYMQVAFTITRAGNTLTITGDGQTVTTPIIGETGVLQITQDFEWAFAHTIYTVTSRFRWIAEGSTPPAPTEGWSSLIDSSTDGVVDIDWLMIAGAATTPPIFWVVAREGSEAVTLTPTAKIEASGFTMRYALIDQQDSAWEFLQRITDQMMGAALVTDLGTLEWYSKDRLRGGGVTSSEALKTDRLGDLPWTVDLEQVADRIEVVWTPNEITTTASASQTVWEAEGPIRVAGKSSTTVDVVLDGMVVGGLSSFTQSTTGTEISGSRWIAFTTAEGTSTIPADTAIQVEIKWLTPAKFRLTITNTTSGTLWIRTESGGGGLILRTDQVVRRGDQQTFGLGASEEAAENPYRHDGGDSIQTLEDAQNLAAWLQSTLTGPLPVLQGVPVRPDFSRKLGQVITIYDPRNTGIRSRALIYGISNSQTGAADIKQSLNLALLGFTIADKATYFISKNPIMTISQRALWLQATLGDVTLNEAAAWLEANGVEV